MQVLIQNYHEFMNARGWVTAPLAVSYEDNAEHTSPLAVSYEDNAERISPLALSSKPSEKRSIP